MTKIQKFNELHFYKVFRRLKNCSPSEYRALLNKELRQ
jgi:AraC-like DNA-binding protein